MVGHTSAMGSWGTSQYGPFVRDDDKRMGWNPQRVERLTASTPLKATSLGVGHTLGGDLRITRQLPTLAAMRETH